MGRKPNPLIAEYFRRGAKLDDASNRYEHTCKLCGENFPKGRIDSLTAHLTRKCTGLNMAERTQIVLRLHDLSDPNAEMPLGVSSQDGAATEAGNTVNLPFSPTKQQNFNALNVLAEASRRVGGNTPTVPGYSTAEEAQHLDLPQPLPVDPQLEIDSFTRQLLESTDEEMPERHNDFPTTTGASLPSLFPFMSTGPQVASGILGLSMVTTHPPDLSTIAASANETLANGIMDSGLDVSHDGVSSALLEGLTNNTFPPPDRSAFEWSNTTAQAIVDQAEMNAHVHSENPQDAEEHSAQSLRLIAMNPNGRPTNFVSETGGSNKVQKPKVRGRFAPQRRKEVREIRKVGACMRCRMLKKVCSQETPCQTCAAVETPRLWKHSCVRTKLVECYPIYFVGVYSAIAFRRTNHAKEHCEVKPMEGRIEAFHFDGVPIAFKGLKIVNGSADLAAPDDLLIIDLQTDNVLPKMEQYLQAISGPMVQEEPCPIMKGTLTTVIMINSSQQANPAFEKQDNLLSDVVELWTATVVLSDPALKWNLVRDNGPSIGAQVIGQNEDSLSHSLMIAQLQAAVEKRAGLVCRAAMHHFEQRVLSRHKNNNFETFLAAFVLLNCAERMCWLLRTWESDEMKAPSWPLDSAPHLYAEKGQNLAETVHMLLHLRQLDPKITIDPRSGKLIPRNNEDTALASWLNLVGLSKERMIQKAATEFDLYDSRSLDGALSMRLLQI